MDISITAIVLALISPAITIFIFRAAEKARRQKDLKEEQERREKREEEQDKKIEALRLEIVTRFTRIETRMDSEEKYRVELNSNMMMHMRETVWKYCQEECPHRQRRPITKPAPCPGEGGA